MNTLLKSKNIKGEVLILDSIYEDKSLDSRAQINLESDLENIDNLIEAIEKNKKLKLEKIFISNNDDSLQAQIDLKFFIDLSNLKIEGPNNKKPFKRDIRFSLMENKETSLPKDRLTVGEERKNIEDEETKTSSIKPVLKEDLDHVDRDLAKDNIKAIKDRSFINHTFEERDYGQVEDLGDGVFVYSFNRRKVNNIENVIDEIEIATGKKTLISFWMDANIKDFKLVLSTKARDKKDNEEIEFFYRDKGFKHFSHLSKGPLETISLKLIDEKNKGGVIIFSQVNYREMNVDEK